MTRTPPTLGLPGVGPAREERLREAGYDSLESLARLVPSALVEGLDATPLAELEPGVESVVEGVVEASSLRRFGRRSRVALRLVDAAEVRIDLVAWNQPWLARQHPVGARVRVRGALKSARAGARREPAAEQKPDGGAREFLVARFEKLEAPLAPGAVQPRYPSIEGVGEKALQAACLEAARRVADAAVEELDAETLARHGLMPLPDALRALHAPPDIAAFEAARRRVALDDWIALHRRLVARARELRAGAAIALAISDSEWSRLMELAPFGWTNAQRRVLGEIREDLAQATPMRRLLQGDVGAGKTAVALVACLAAATRGGQAAFLAPTELLARQHAQVGAAWCAAAGVRHVLLTGALKSRERAEALRRVESGEARVVFGTHALLSDSTVFRELQVAVVDEQHRFGVAQRSRLLQKGRDVHALLTTATPIPRTLALALHGELDSSILDERPRPMRVATRLVTGKGGKQVEAELVASLERGGRLFWIVPRVGADDEPTEDLSASAGKPAKGALERQARLLASPLARFGIELVHGRLDPDQRDAALLRFKSGATRVLVATTVVEVGLDVPDADLLVIEGADQLGLAQLHQLRGRVGRAGQEARCWLFGAKSAHARLRFLETCSDGFQIAEEDLRVRGMGELAGLRQSGLSDGALGAALADPGLFELARRLA
ncbi:MAG: ATP-dependent helicase RecG, partial [Planctomycetota bacterium]